MSRCNYCLVEDGEGHRHDCRWNNEAIARERRKEQEIDSMTTNDLLKEILRSLRQSSAQ